eukprot:14332280-Alexandrium_andersonii.AAC.1
MQSARMTLCRTCLLRPEWTPGPSTTQVAAGKGRGKAAAAAGGWLARPLLCLCGGPRHSGSH